jgi:hypothetical protein
VEIEIIIIAIIINTPNLKEEIAIVDQVAGIQVEAHFIKILEFNMRKIIRAIDWIVVEISQRERVLLDRNKMINSRIRKDVIIFVNVLDATTNQRENCTFKKVSKKEYTDMIEIICRSHLHITPIF